MYFNSIKIIGIKFTKFSNLRLFSRKNISYIGLVIYFRYNTTEF